MKNQKGFSLVELMVSLVLGLLLIGGVLSIFLSNQQTFRSNEGLSRLQENARISFELMARDIRQAGGTPCGAQLVSNLVNNATTTWSLNWDAGTLIGFSGNQTATAVVTGTTSGQRVAGTDAIQILSGNLSETETIVSNSTTTSVIGVSTSTHGISAADIVMVCDGASAAIAQITSVSGTSLAHVTGSGTPGNATAGLGYPTGTAKTLQPGALLSRFTASTWYVGVNSRGGRSLYRKDATDTEEIAEGVVDMDIAYLQSTKATGVLDSDWVEASSISNWLPTAAKHVVAVRLKLKLETTTRIGTNQQVLSRDVVHVVNIRNRGI